MEYAADEITNLNESYVKLEKEVENLSVPDDLPAGEQLRIQEIKDDLLLAISNRSLAVVNLSLCSAAMMFCIRHLWIFILPIATAI